MDEFKEKLDQILNNQPSTILSEEDLKKAKKFFQLLAKAKQPTQSTTDPKTDDPCIEEDCSDILSPCCNSIMENKFGSLPLQVICKSCNKIYFLKELLLKFKQDKTP